jgi:hypothetical protein
LLTKFLGDYNDKKRINENNERAFRGN